MVSYKGNGNVGDSTLRDACFVPWSGVGTTVVPTLFDIRLRLGFLKSYKETMLIVVEACIEARLLMLDVRASF